MTTIRRNTPTHSLSAATFRDDLSREDLCEVEASWCPARALLRRDLFRNHTPENEWPQHLHWNWGILAKSLALPGRRCDALECDGEHQGIALSVVDPADRGMELPPFAADGLVYLDYIEVAPWNLKSPVTAAPRFSFVGARLVQHLVRVSLAEGFEGRLGLHSLPQSEPTYATWGMSRLGTDPGYNDLAYFEFGPAAAANFLDRDCK